MSDWMDVLAAQQDAEDDTAIAALLAARPRTIERTDTAEYDVSEIVVTRRGGSIVVSRIRVSRTTFADPTEPPYVEARGFGRRARKDGKPDVRSAPLWHDLPAALVDRLLPMRDPSTHSTARP